jgi:hypothetical protein
MKQYLAVFFWLCCQSVSHADNYIMLDNRLSIQMPGTYPDTFSRGKMAGYATYWYRISYEAISKKDKSAPAVNAMEFEFEEYYDQFVKTWLAEMKGKLKTQSKFTLDGFPGREVYFEAQNSADLPQLWYSRIIAMDGRIFIFSINAAKGNREKLENTSLGYFASLHQSQDNETIREEQEKEYRNKRNEQYNKLRHQRELVEKERELRYQGQTFEHIRWLVLITLLTIFFFAGAIGLFFLIRHYYKKYD